MMDWQLISSNVVALAAIIAPLIVESKRQKKEQKSVDWEKQKQDNITKDNLVIDYISSLNSFYEALEGENDESKIILKNKAAVVKNKILFEFQLPKLWRTENIEINKKEKDVDKKGWDEDFNNIFRDLKKYIKNNNFENSLINVIDITQNILQANCDSEDYSADCRKELKTLLEILPIIHSGYKFQKIIKKDEKVGEDSAKESIYIYIDKYLDEAVEYDKIGDVYKIRVTDKSVAEYYKRIFESELRENENFERNFKEKLETNNQYGKIHKNLSQNQNVNSYEKIKIGKELYFINKNCNRSTAENFIVKQILPLVK